MASSIWKLCLVSHSLSNRLSSRPRGIRHFKFHGTLREEIHRPRARSALHQQVIRRVGRVALAERTGLKGSEDDEDDEGTEDEGYTTARWRI